MSVGIESVNLGLSNTVVPALAEGLQREPVPCDDGDLLVVALLYGRLSITHAGSGMSAFWMKFPPTAEGLAKARMTRDALLACGIDWTKPATEIISGATDAAKAAMKAIQADCTVWLEVHEPYDDSGFGGDEDDDDEYEAPGVRFDVDAILAYDAGRASPAATPEIAACLRAIANKPHHAPLLLAALIQQAKAELC